MQCGQFVLQSLYSHPVASTCLALQFLQFGFHIFVLTSKKQQVCWRDAVNRAAGIVQPKAEKFGAKMQGKPQELLSNTNNREGVVGSFNFN